MKEIKLKKKNNISNKPLTANQHLQEHKKKKSNVSSPSVSQFFVVVFSFKKKKYCFQTCGYRLLVLRILCFEEVDFGENPGRKM